MALFRSPHPEAHQEQSAIVRPGRNCWRVADAERAAVLVDAAAYFAELESAIRSARRSILIVGWDFDPRIRLRPDQPEALSPRLGDLLREAVDFRSELEVFILVWSVAAVHGPSGARQLLIGEAWQEHERIRLKLDVTHPLYATHHQKIVCVDSGLAFVGGVDVTVDRWDTPEHRAERSDRRLPSGASFGPVHDAMIMFSGDAAGETYRLARRRWADATGESLPLPNQRRDLWPEGRKADFRGVRLALARTIPAWGERPARFEAAQLTLDAFVAAKSIIYFEAQYLAASYVAEALEQRLSEPSAPEVVAVVSLAARTLVERWIMGGNRDRIIRRLRRADQHDRFRIYSPVVPSPKGDCSVLIHSKLIIVDDWFLKIGSSNLNNRSIGLDTELDAAIEAKDDIDRNAIAKVRNGLLAEHLGVSAELFGEAVEEAGSFVCAIERLNCGPRRLNSFDAVREDGSVRPVFGTSILDPAGPLEPVWLLKRRRGARSEID
jgi:phosphatidylserine/phosphatidylglycerophosphate/cardiolipin synthase-like enzyme